jgi:hypothetical protein
MSTGETAAAFDVPSRICAIVFAFSAAAPATPGQCRRPTGGRRLQGRQSYVGGSITPADKVASIPTPCIGPLRGTPSTGRRVADASYLCHLLPVGALRLDLHAVPICSAPAPPGRNATATVRVPNGRWTVGSVQRRVCIPWRLLSVTSNSRY